MRRGPPPVGLQDSRTRRDTDRAMRRIALLGLGAFVVASDGTLVIGLLRQVADSLDVSASAAGQAVTVFAAAYAIGGPLLVHGLRRARPERVLAGSLALFIVANLGTAAASSLP